MTNTQGLYFCVAITFIVAIALVYMVVRRNKDEDYNRDNGQRAARYTLIGLLGLPLFVVLGIGIIVVILLFHTP